jgi:hypothetical protein
MRGSACGQMLKSTPRQALAFLLTLVLLFPLYPQALAQDQQPPAQAPSGPPYVEHSRRCRSGSAVGRRIRPPQDDQTLVIARLEPSRTSLMLPADTHSDIDVAPVAA